MSAANGSHMPPHDLDTEAAVLSAVLLDSAALTEIPELEPSHFYSEAHRRIFEACRAVAAAGKPIDAVTVGERLKDTNRLEQVGGAGYLVTILDAAPRVRNVASYARSLREKAYARAMSRVCQRFQAEIHQDPDPLALGAGLSIMMARLRTEHRLDDTTEPSSTARLTRLADVEPQPIRWLWPGWIPLGKLSLVDGDPGLGKSLMTLDIAARVSCGGAMPGGAQGAGFGQPAGVVLLTAEDDPADTLRPRLDAAGADVSRIVMLGGVQTKDGERMPRLGDVEAIRDAIASVDARLVIIDPLMAYLGGDAHRDNEVRQSLGPIAKLAAERSVAVLVVRHLNKSGGAHAVYRGGGSIGIIGAARVGMLVARDPEDDARRVLAAVKSNLAELPDSLSYSIVAKGGDVPAVDWLGTSSHTADSLLVAAAEDGVEPTASDEAAEWLRGELGRGPRRSSDLKGAARAAGLTWRTVERAKVSLVVTARRLSAKGAPRGAGVWAWALPGDTRDLQDQDRQDDQDRHGGLEDSVDVSPANDQDRHTRECGGDEHREGAEGEA